jgi:hypothetical protein
MEQLVLLLVIAAISLVNWLIERSAKLREQRRREKEASNQGQPPPVSSPSFPEPSPREEIEDQMRRMLESFGLPVEDPKPLPQKPEPVFVFEEPIAPQLPPPRPLAPPPRTALRRGLEKSTPTRTHRPWTSRLGSPQGLREAIVLREILGPPKALSES